MKKAIFGFLFLVTLSIVAFGYPLTSEAANYPGTSIEAKSGDILWSPKNSSTYFAGHVAIVGSDGKIYHSYPNGSGKRVDSLDTYINDLFKDSEIRVRRYSKSANFTNIGDAAKSLYNQVEDYKFNIELGNYKNNYCSKFVWQAYYLATGVDPLNAGYTLYDRAYILPSEFKNSTEFSTIKTYVR